MKVGFKQMLGLGLSLQWSRQRAGKGILSLNIILECRHVLTLAVLGEDTGSDAADILSADAGVLNLHLDCRQRHHVEVALIGQNRQAALTVVLRPAAAKPGDAYPPHSGAIRGRQLQLHLRAHLWQGENLNKHQHGQLNN